MGRQFKTISPVTRQVSEDFTPEKAVHSDIVIDSAGDVRPLLRLPATPSAKAHRAPCIQDMRTEKQPVFPAPTDLQTPCPDVLDKRYSTRGVSQSSRSSVSPVLPLSGVPVEYGGVPPTLRRPTPAPSTPWPSDFAGQFEVPRASSGQNLPASAHEAESRPRVQHKQQKQRQRSVVAIAALLSCCLCFLLLTGGGYWYFHKNGAPAPSAPAAVPTQVRYTIASTAPTSSATASATVTPVASPGATATSQTRIPALSPVPMPWQTDSPLIVVSITKQKLTAYDHGQVALTTLVTTGMPTLYTPEGTYHIIGRIANAMFTSPWPPSSPNYYAPIHVNFGLQLTASGIYLHDATWRSVFGPGTNVPHNDPVYGQETGSHGCVELPVQAMSLLYNWAQNGIVVAVVN